MIIPPLYKYGAIAAVWLATVVYAAAVGHHGGAMGVQTRWDAQIAADAQKAAERRVEVETNNTKEVIRYVDVYKTVEVSVPHVVTKLVRLCPAGDPRNGVPSAGDPAAPIASDANAGRLDDLGVDLIAARGNLEQCKALITVIQQQLPKE